MKEKQEKKLTTYDKYDKKDFIKLLFSLGIIATVNAVLIPIMFSVNQLYLYIIGTSVFLSAIPGVVETFFNYGEGTKNYIYSKKYSKKYYETIEDKIETVLDYKYIAKQSYDIYFSLKNNASTPVQFLEELKVKAFEDALKAKMISNIYKFNLKGNEKYFSDMIMSKNETDIEVTHHPEYFDLQQDKANKYIEKYNKLEELLKNDCDIRLIDRAKLGQEIQPVTQNKVQKQNETLNTNQNHSYKSKDKPFEQ